MRAAIVGGNVFIYVEDSGRGVPLDKRSSLFAKYQSSLDVLSQGTGVGLCLSKKIMTTMSGDLWLDASYNSGFEHCPGARFVVQLNTAPIDIETQMPNMADGGNSSLHDVICETSASSTQNGSFSGCGSPCLVKPSSAVKAHTGESDLPVLPEFLSILFVDDDATLRKLFVRGVRRIGGPGWSVREAASGEMALQLCTTTEEKFDLIFLDQYMASVDKQLLGTETARALRNIGIDAKICGLSANNLRESFLNAGADAFIQKPLPCAKDKLTRELDRILKPAV